MSARKRKTPVYVGLSVTRHAIEMASFSPRNFIIERSVAMPTPPGLLDENGDQVLDEGLMREIIGQLLRQFGGKIKQLHLSLPGTLLRMVEMQRMGDDELHFALSSEAERYKSFDNTDAMVDFAVLGENQGNQRIMLGAVRSDTLMQYSRILQSLKIKPASISLEPLNVLRGMAGTGVLDSLVQQIGVDSQWGVIFVEPERVRISLWQGSALLEMRETHMNTQEFDTATDNSIVVDDLVEEIRRSCKNLSPVIWLTYQMAESMRHFLAQRLELPFTPCMLGNTLALDQPNLSLPAVGVTMSSTVEFPFEFNLMTGAPKSTGGKSSATSAAAVPDSDGDKQTGDMLMKLGVGSIAAGVLMTGALFGANEFWAKGEVAKLQTRQQQMTQDIASLQARINILKAENAVQEALMTMIKNARIRNKVYVELTGDLQKKTPEKLWVHSLKVGDELELAGNALAHQAVINFARSFDGLPYLSSVMIDSIKENFIAGTTLFDFKIGGNVVLDKHMLNQAELLGQDNGNRT